MTPTTKPYVQLAINEVNTVVKDLEGVYDADQFDRYATFEEARDAALSCVELILDAGDYDDDEHRIELEAMLRLLESAGSYRVLARNREYRAFVARLEPATAA